MIKTYIMALRPQFFTAVIVPILIGTATAKVLNNLFSLKLFVLTILASVLFHGSMNLFNDYFDDKNGTDNLNKEMLSPFTGGSRVIQNGLMTPKIMFIYGFILLTLGCVTGLYLAVLSGPELYFIGLTGLLTGFFYSAPPLFLASRGIGEICVALNFGFLSVLGTYFVQTSLLSVTPLMIAIVPAMLITAVLYINQFPDYNADKEVGKNNLVVRFGKAKSRKGLPILFLIAYISIIIMPFVLSSIGFFIYISLLTIPMAVMATKGLYLNYDNGIKLAPAIEKVIQTHLLTGILLAIGIMIQYFKYFA